MKFIKQIIIIFLFFIGSLTTQSQNPISKTKNLTKGQQSTLCYIFNRYGITELRKQAIIEGFELHDIYHCIKCDDATNADLIKHRASLPSARADLMSFARYYIREHNDEEGLKAIFNSIIDNPGKPNGTLLDFVDFYSDNPYLTKQDKINFAAYEVTIRRFGGKRFTELTEEERKKYRVNKCNK